MSIKFTLLALTLSIASKQVEFKYSSNNFINEALFIGFSIFIWYCSISVERLATDCLCNVLILHVGKLYSDFFVWFLQ